MTNPFACEQHLAELAVLRASILTKSVQSIVSEISKNDNSPVTIADFAAQALLVGALRDAFPNDAFLGEEDSTALRADQTLCNKVYDLVLSATDVADRNNEGALLPKPSSVDEMLSLIDLGGNGIGGNKGRFWVMDPIDGTATFLKGQQYAVSLSLIENGKQVVGVLGCPNISPDMTRVSEENIAREGLGIMLTAVRGQGTAIRTMTSGGLGDAFPLRILAPTKRLHIVDCAASDVSRHDVIAELAHRFKAKFPDIDLWSSHIRYAALIVGGGSAHFLIPASPDFKMCIWDHAGAQLIFTELGGKSPSASTSITMQKSEAMSDSLVAEAEAAIAWEHSLSPRRALKLYSKAVWLGAFVSLALVMEGFDTKIMGSLYAVPAFQQDYGARLPDGSYQISASWQSGMGAITGVTSILGMFLGGYLAERFGFRKTMAAALLSMPPIIFIFFFAPSLQVLAVANFFMGIFQTVTTVYVTEIMPNALRPYLTSFYSLAWVSKWFWPLVVIIAVYLSPESPWWLVRQNRRDEAEAAVASLTSGDMGIDIQKLVSLMVFTTHHERNVESGTSYLACFKGVNLRRTTIVMGVYVMQVLTGAPVRGYMTYFFLQAGLPVDQSFNMTIIALVLSVLGVLGALVVMTYVGRRQMYLWGTLITVALFAAIGGMGAQLRKSSSAALLWGIGSLLAVDGFVANLLVLPVTFVMVAEIPSSLLRSKSVVVARNTYSVINIVAGTITPFMLNPTAWNWNALSGFFWAGAGVIGFVFTYFMVPESKGRTTAEMDILFEQKVPVRKFKEAEVSISHVEEKGLT
ncbi:hypothetical protein CkaCkLH20_08449 [Colletotrichum karsti]|uniref:Major facilitator superfamily (MFS) profile domain-containing protein n=1 Tax=Colletotrichum karsti TaxID=1095194 RepID=A0A9P6HZ93_9PEZI|nr:uncharacterized protein CkaCkLH20_08449 [Colletotrichum karsti]KAF9874077.1 hypothetical protein CkaCkLH20_08449 [Colletotrichum karsti]